MTSQDTAHEDTLSQAAQGGPNPVTSNVETSNRLLQVMGLDAFNQWFADFNSGKTTMGAKQLVWMLDSLGEEHFLAVIGLPGGSRSSTTDMKDGSTTQVEAAPSPPNVHQLRTGSNRPLALPQLALKTVAGPRVVRKVG